MVEFSTYRISIIDLSAHFLSVDRLQIPPVSRPGQCHKDFDIDSNSALETKVIFLATG